MFKQSLYILFRRFGKDPVFSLITLMNLTVGFATFILISQFISGMLNYDKHNVNYDRIYRVQMFQDQPENRIKHSSSITAALSRHELVNQPEIEKIALLHDVGDNNKSGVFLSPDKKNEFLTRYGYYADPTAFEIFTFHFIEGDAHDALKQPGSIVLSKSVADKLFKSESALGKQVYGENKLAFTVTGVFEDIPDKSTWKPAFLLPMCSFGAITGWKDYENNYWAYSFYTYVLLKPNADPSVVDARIHDAMKNYRKEHSPYLRPMSALYLRPFYDKDMFIAVGLFGFIALLILILSAINYINLQTANASTRFREIGIKKAVGFSNKELWAQFMTESMSLALIGGLLGIIVAQLTVPAFNRMLGGKVVTTQFYDLKLISMVMGISLITGFLSGLHPAFAISSFNPVTALKQKFSQEQSNGISLKKVLLTAQFSISIFLLVVSFIVYRQTHFMLTKDMGFESHNLLFANISTNQSASFDALRQRLLSHPGIADACQSDYIPFILPGGNEMSWEGAAADEKVYVRYSFIGYDFIPTYNMSITTGRNFSREFPADANKCLINETAAKTFGWTEPIGKHLKVKDINYEVIGVIKDYVAFSVHMPLEPHLYRLISDSISTNRVYSIRFVPGNEKKVREIASQEFEQFFPNDAFEFKNIQQLIQHDQGVEAWKRLMKVCLCFAILSVFISSIGLFGLMLFFTRSKLKEVGIRKVLGFSFGQLYYTMSALFIKLLLFSIVIAWPAAYYVYRGLPGANKYPIQLWEFIIATLIVLLVALATISYQIVRAVKVRPVEILKDE
jgi:putative ABC transport system permease protein